MKLRYLLLSFLLFPFLSNAQNPVTLSEIRQNYQSFNYGKVIELSTQLLTVAELKDDELIELHTMRAVSHFSLNDETSAKASFIGILKINNDYSLDPAFISPKIITLFENTKKDFNQIVQDTEDVTQPVKTELPEDIGTVNFGLVQSFMLKSIVLPGWGHLSAGKNIKGLLLSATSVVTLGSMIYYIIDANKKEKDYLNETDRAQIDSKFNAFNDSFKIKNSLIFGYAALWLFTQLDLLVFDTDYNSSSVKLYPQLNSNNNLQLSLNIRF